MRIFFQHFKLLAFKLLLKTINVTKIIYCLKYLKIQEFWNKTEEKKATLSSYHFSSKTKIICTRFTMKNIHFDSVNPIIDANDFVENRNVLSLLVIKQLTSHHISMTFMSGSVRLYIIVALTLTFLF